MSIVSESESARFGFSCGEFQLSPTGTCVPRRTVSWLATPVSHWLPMSPTSRTRHHFVAQKVSNAGVLCANVTGDHWNEWGCCSIRLR